MYFIRIESFVFSHLSHSTNTLPVLKSSFLSVFIFCFVVGITGGSKSTEVLGDVRSTQEKEVIVTDQPFAI